MPIIEIENVSKHFRASRGVRAIFGRGGLAEWARRSEPEESAALEDISFAVDAGESVGIIGANGSGKSTLLKIIAGVTTPTSGHVRVFGRVASLLELGAGFHPMLTGRENVFLNAGIHGVRHAQTEAMMDQIIEFSGLGSAIDNPVATYSSGMYVRLGFAVATYTNPDIFLIDEVLAVGDEEFQRRCRHRIGELMEQGKTLLFVSHDLSIVNVLCKRVILLSQGRMIVRDTPTRAIDFYLRQIGAPEGLHTLRDGPLEVILCNGRISIFYDEVEVTSSQGIHTNLLYLRSWQPSQSAQWTILEGSETHCVARGRFTKLWIDLIWDLRLANGEFTWSAAYECVKPMDLSAIENHFAFPTSYTRWVYDDESNSFQDIIPDDSRAVPMRSAEILCERAGLLAENEEEHRAIELKFESDRPALKGSWWNSDFISGSRVFILQEQEGDAGLKLPQGRMEAFRVRFAIGSRRDALLEDLGAEISRKVVTSGALRGRFDRGNLRLTSAGGDIPAGAWVYTSMLIDNLWNDSKALRWDRLERAGESIRVSGASRRFPFSMEWRVEPGEKDTLRLFIDLIVNERIEVQEYHASLVAPIAYEEWATPSEKGTFPPIRTDSNDWVHLNKEYMTGTYMATSGTSVPRIEFGVGEQNEMVLTAVNANYSENYRVLQALATPKHGSFVFEPGRHRYFEGSVSIGPGRAD